jgi:hypothetical protein
MLGLVIMSDLYLALIITFIFTCSMWSVIVIRPPQITEVWQKAAIVALYFLGCLCVALLAIILIILNWRIL